MEHATHIDESSVTLKGPVPPIRRVNFNGIEYASTDDIVGWLNYVADNLVDEDADGEERQNQEVAADVIRVLANFTSQAAAV